MFRVASRTCISILLLFSGCAVRAPAVVPDKVVATHIRINHANPPRIGFAYYPASSRRTLEQGVCKVSVTVLADGAVKDVHVTQSTGYPALDAASVDAFPTGTLLPATENGRAVDATVEIPVTWTIKRVVQ
jgi:TonB family protein